MNRLRLTAAAALLLGAGQARAQLGPAPEYARVTDRAPTASDSPAFGYAVGSGWLDATGAYFQLQDATGGVSSWVPVTNKALPLDVIGRHVVGLTVATAGTGYASGDVISFDGGGGASATYNGTTWAISNLQWYGCEPAGAVGQTTAPASGGTGATFTLSFARAIGHGTHLLSACWSGPLLTIARADTGKTKAISALPNGMLDETAADAFLQNSTQNASLTAAQNATIDLAAIVVGENDQGGAGFDSTVSGTPHMLPFRREGNSRSVLFDNGFMVLPTYMTEDVQNHTVAALSGTRSVASGYVPGVIDLGFGAAKIWLDQGTHTGFTLAYRVGNLASGSSTTLDSTAGIADSADSLWDQGNVTIGSAIAGADTLLQNGLVTTATDTDIGTTTKGGYVGQSNASDGALDIEVPWGLTAAQEKALAASIAQTYALPPQGQDVLVAVGHSLNEGTGTYYQQSIWRQMLQQLHRPDIHLVNVGKYGSTCVQGQTELTNEGLPALAKRGGLEVVTILCGDNDLAANTSLTGQQIANLYDPIATLAHNAGALTLCVQSPYSSRSYAAAGGGSALTQAQAASVIATADADIALKVLGPTNTSGLCNRVVDERALPAFNQQNGPFSSEFYADGVHPTNEAAAG
ncbi:MAG: SGNH/GDSL hydrolase family protein, partial [Janthinobacterium lividum]